MKPKPIPLDLMRSSVYYDDQTGHLRWQASVSFRDAVPHGIVGSIKKDGYRLFRINDEYFAAHRVIWALMTGETEFSSLDHIDGNRSNNRISNLRIATPSQNSCNMATSASSGLKGATRNKNGWQSIIWYQNVSYYLGLFPSAHEAHLAYRAKAIELHGEFANYSRGNTYRGDISSQVIIGAKIVSQAPA